MIRRKKLLINGLMVIVLVLVFSILVGEEVMAKNKKENSKANAQSILDGFFIKPSDEEIEKILNLRTTDYKKLSLIEFRNQIAVALLDYDINDAFQKIKAYISENPKQLDVNLDEHFFLKYTLPCTYGEEIYTNVEKKRTPAFYNRINIKFEEQGEMGSITETDCNIEYSVGYTIADDTKFTVAQRDKIILNVTNEMQSYIDIMFAEPIKNKEECYNKLQQKFDEVVKENSSSKMKLTVGYISM